MKRRDIIIIAVLIVASLAVFFINKEKDRQKGRYAFVYVDNELYSKEDLNQTKTFDIKTKNGFNRIKIHDGGIEISEANCPDKVCVNTGFITKPSQSIVCIPNRVQIKISGESGSETDNPTLDATTNEN